MTKYFRKGIITASTYYGIGLALVILTVFIWDNQYAHAPGLPFIIAALVIIGGTCLLLVNLLLFTKAYNRNRKKGSMLVHGLLLDSTCILIVILINKESKYEDIIRKVDSEYLIIGQDSRTLTIMKESGDTTLSQKKGSFIIKKTVYLKNDEVNNINRRTSDNI